MNVEQHAEAILRAAFGVADRENLYLDPIILRQSLTAVEAAMVAGAKAMREAAINQVEQNAPGMRITVAAVRALDPAAIVKGM